MSTQEQPRSSDEYWMNDILHQIEELQDQTLKAKNYDVQKRIVETTKAITIIYLLLMAYRKSPEHKIAGEGGVGQQMKCTKERIFEYLAALELEPKDFFDPDSVSIEHLVENSAVSTFARQIQESNGQYFALLAQEEQ